MRKYLLVISAGVFALDALTKWLIKDRIPLGSNIDLIPGLFRFTHLENNGMAFSLLADSSSPWPSRFLLLFSLVALVAISVLLWRTGTSVNLTTVSLALFLGGTLGNLCDRLLRGRVTDFLDFYVGPHHWPPFNVADSAIVVGALLLAGNVFFGTQKDTAKSA